MTYVCVTQLQCVQHTFFFLVQQAFCSFSCLRFEIIQTTLIAVFDHFFYIHIPQPDVNIYAYFGIVPVIETKRLCLACPIKLNFYWVPNSPLISYVIHAKLQHQCSIAYWGWDKMATILQKIFRNRFSWMKMFEFHWSLFMRVQLTMNWHWFR